MMKNSIIVACALLAVTAATGYAQENGTQPSAPQTTNSTPDMSKKDKSQKMVKKTEQGQQEQQGQAPGGTEQTPAENR